MADPAAGPRDEDESDVPVYFVRPSENVWSFFTFVAPTEAKKADLRGEEGTTWDVVMAYILVIATATFQGILLWLLFDEVVLSNVAWQNGIMKVGNTHQVNLFSDPPKDKCNAGSSLCFNDSGNFTCAPPSVQLTGRWDMLDTNKDGIWTREEVEASKEELHCKFAVNPVEIFDVLINIIKKRSHLIWIHPDIQNAKGIHFAYFQYALGDIAMCGYREEAMCNNLIKRGFFDTAFIHGTAPRVGKTTETALAYCRGLLQPQGICEELLPSTYTVWKIASSGECGSKDYTKFKYTNPGTKLTKSLLEVDYSARGEYELAQEFWFRIFKGIVLLVWVAIIFCEFKEIIKFVSLVLYFPDAAQFGRDFVLVEVDPADPEDVRYRLQGITPGHRKTIACLCLLRICLTSALLIVGMSYIVKTNDYADLLMNGVALAFVAEISAVMYSQVLREEIRDQTEDIKPIKVPMFGIHALNRFPALLDIVLLGGLIAFCYFTMEAQMTGVVLPIYRSLECACLQTGEECFEAQRFNQAFWHKYWQHTVPWIYKELEGLKAALPAGAASYAAVHAGAKLAAHQELKSVDVSRENAAMKELEELETENKDIQRKVLNLKESMESRSHSQIRKPQNLFGAHSSGRVSL
eukprot:gnl/MRDRNA2_/MRDRNA2_58742_c0_seq2.p1 gnl/MRDRNA2_/MRDRNA2_58742_c0~~gnl/MRDRNA2_/MRDRNA2_58742_c0_seq2.p1  ORF type:complete len:635 (-),score=105.28 gnl/MRDRNA2_/MRDRNA2_58742_c0_seq2:151-2055(-)